jgi:hypothetical protein
MRVDDKILSVENKNFIKIVEQIKPTKNEMETNFFHCNH